MMLVNEMTVSLANKLSKYYDFITEDGNTFAELRTKDISSIKADNIKPLNNENK